MEIVFHGLTLHCPFSSHFRRHTERELTVMEGTIREYGIRDPIRIYTDTTLNKENCVADGEGRLTLAVKLGLPFEAVRFEDFGEMTTAEAYEGIALVHNDGRRQDDADAVEKRRREIEERHARIHRVVQAREEGKSIRTIAEEIGVSKSQIERDLADAGGTVPGGTVNAPERITGKDGREQPATKPKPVAPVVDSTPKFTALPPPPPPPPPTPIPKETRKAVQRTPFDWGPLENALGNVHDLLADAMGKLHLTDSYEHKAVESLLDDIEMILFSDKQKDLSLKWRLQHA